MALSTIGQELKRYNINQLGIFLTEYTLGYKMYKIEQFLIVLKVKSKIALLLLFYKDTFD